MKTSLLQLIITSIFLCVVFDTYAQDFINEGNALVRSIDPVFNTAINNSSVPLDRPSDIFVSGDYAYVTVYEDSSVEVIDISDPSNPIHVGGITDNTTTALQGASSIFVSGNYAYVASGIDDGVEILDISVPSNPTHVGAITDNATTELNGAQDIFVSGKYAYVVSDTDNSLEILDISDPANPTHVGAISDNATTLLNGAYSIYVSGDYAYVGSYSSDDGIEILDISDPTNPTHAGSIADNGNLLLNGVSSVFVSGNYAYVTAFQSDDGVQVLDISDPSNPNPIGSIADNDTTFLKWSTDVFISGNYAYVTSRNDGIEILDISDPSNPTHAGGISSNTSSDLSGPLKIFISGNNAYVATNIGNAFSILDITGIVASVNSTDTLSTSSIDIGTHMEVSQELITTQDINIGNDGLGTSGTIHTEQFTQLGEQAPAIKLKIIESTTAGTSGGNNPVAHGLDSNKIISVEGLVRYLSNNDTTGTIDGDKAFPGYELSLSWDSSNINILNIAGNSFNIYNKDVIITIMYTE